MNRQQRVRQRPVLAPPLQTVNPSSPAGGSRNFKGSPTVQPTPPSQNSPPSTARSPGFVLHGGMASPTSELQAQQHQHQQGQQQMPHGQHHSFPPQSRTHMRNVSMPGTSQPMQLPRPSSQANAQTNYYSNAFPKHYDQLGKFTYSHLFLSSSGALFVLG